MGGIESRAVAGGGYAQSISVNNAVNSYMYMMQKIIKKLPIHSRWRLALKTIPLIVGIIGIKFVVHYLGYEFLQSPIHPSRLFEAFPLSESR